MRKKLNNKIAKGFTLIEIIVVLIIIGIFVAIGVPNLFSNVNKSRSAEAFANINAIRSVLEACIASHPGQEDACRTCNHVANSASFFYYVYGPNQACSAIGDTGYQIIAWGYGPGSGAPSGSNGIGLVPPGPFNLWADTIQVSRASTPTPGIGAVTCLGTGVLSSAC